MILKGLRKNYEAKKCFMVGWQIKKNSDNKYEDALKIWNSFKLKTMKNYYELHLLLSADVFEKLRNNSFKNYGLCLSLYLSALALSWDAIHNRKKIDLELTSDAGIFLFFVTGMNF